MFFYNSDYLLMVMLPTFILMMAAQLYVSSAYRRWSQVRNGSGLTGAEALGRLIDHAAARGVGVETGGGIRSLRLEMIGGNLTDHYDPRSKVIRLSPAVAQQPSVAAVAIAAHELGHALQDQEDYFPLRLRGAMVPAVQIGSWLGWILIFAGLIFGLTGLAWLGVLVFSTGAAFALLTLPVELDASARARRLLADSGIISGGEEQRGVNHVLNAAAFTYVAALITAVLQLLYFVSLVSGRRR
ncbi:MAG: zinc metallopeptidase [Chloroflexi bacterium]|nr:zinc metallopeptidase [Chloroflexota bacterium]